ncbi:MAG: hypothetical protein ACKOTZ_04155 [Chloroflexota bacterium]
MRAVIDIGSNSTHLLAARRNGARLAALVDLAVKIPLGATVDRTGSIGAECAELLDAALGTLIDAARAAGARHVRVLATEPFRRATDARAVAGALEARHGVRVAILSHAQEGRLAARGALAGLPVDEPVLVVDIGGGSTELVLVRPGGRPAVRVVPAGSARLAARVPTADPPAPEAFAALRDAATELAARHRSLRPARAIATGGTATNVNRLLARARTRTLTLADLDRADRRLAAAPAAALAAATGLTEMRIRQLPAGIALLRAILLRHGCTRVAASEAGIREGALGASPVRARGAGVRPG